MEQLYGEEVFEPGYQIVARHHGQLFHEEEGSIALHMELSSLIEVE